VHFCGQHNTILSSTMTVDATTVKVPRRRRSRTSRSTAWTKFWSEFDEVIGECTVTSATLAHLLLATMGIGGCRPGRCDGLMMRCQL
jgi:hypothetical protein